jgi:hypothetical protein
MSTLSASVVLPVNHVDGLSISWASNTTLTVATGSCKDSTNAFDLTLRSATTLSSAFVGVNGLDTGTVAAAQVYAVFVIGQSTGYLPVATLLSTSLTAPVMPTGYDIFRRVGFATTVGSNFIKMTQTGANANRTYWLDTAISVLSGGSSATLAAVDLSACVPAIATKVYFDATFTPNGAGDVASLTDGSSVATVILTLSGSVAHVAQKAQLVTLASLVSGVPKIQYLVTASGALTLLVGAFEDYLA